MGLLFFYDTNLILFLSAIHFFASSIIFNFRSTCRLMVVGT